MCCSEEHFEAGRGACPLNACHCCPTRVTSRCPLAHPGPPPHVQVSEVLDYWGDAGAIAWRLTDGDVRQTLSQRVDFAPHDILALKL